MSRFQSHVGAQLSGSIRALIVGGAAMSALLSSMNCGGSRPPQVNAQLPPVATATGSAPVAPPAPSIAPSSVAPAPSSSSEASRAETGASTENSTPPPTANESAPALDQPPTTIVTAARAAYLIDYANSEAKAKAAANCDKEKKDDATARAACMEKAREQFLADVLVFKSDKKGHETLTIYKRTDSNLREVFSGPVSLKDAGPNSLQVKFKGGGSGQRPLFKNTNSPTIQLPNSYTLEIDDPQFGKLRYDEKIGLVNQ